MNGNVKAFLGFVLGAAISGVAVYIYQDKRLSKKFEEELKVYQRKANSTDENKAETDADDSTTTNTPNDTDSKGEDNMKSNIPQDALDAAKKMQEGVQKAKENREKRGERERSKTNYAKLTRSYGSEGSKEEGGEDMTLSEKIVKNQPYYITEEEFIEWDGKDGYRAVDLFYNADDDSVCNASGEVLEDIWTSIGYDILQDLYDGKNGDEVYVRNDNFKEVYCITKNFMP
jgi:hypothetical protein